MFNYERLLPNLDDLIATKQLEPTSSSESKSVSSSAAASSSSSLSYSASSLSSSASSSNSSLTGQQQHHRHQPDCPVHQQRRSKQQQHQQQPVGEPIKQFTVQLNEARRASDCSSSGDVSGQLFTLPPVVANSSLVRQRASAKDSLAAATVSTGASLPLIIGGRSKCVVNIVEDLATSNQVKNNQHQHQHHHHHHQSNNNNNNNFTSAAAAAAATTTTTSQLASNNSGSSQHHSAAAAAAVKLPPQLPPSISGSQAAAATPVGSPSVVSSGPKNTALRAEQRKQNMVSVVRPVVNHQHTSSQQQQQHYGLPSSFGCEPITSQSGLASSQADSRARKLSTAATVMATPAPAIDLLNGDQPLFNDLYSVGSKGNHQSIIDEFMDLERRAHSHHSQLVNLSKFNYSINSGQLNEFLLSNRLEGSLNFGGSNLSHHQHHHHLHHHLHDQQRPRTEQELRQDMILFRREEFELNRNIKKQHKFVLLKIEERIRNLQIIQSVWVQKDFKHAIEKLVDLYHEGLVFTCNADPTTTTTTTTISGSSSCNKLQQIGDTNLTTNNNRTTTSNSRQSATCDGGGSHTTTTLSSMNTSLVVDVIGVILLRPKLWSLEICQLILPIVVNDLLLQQPTIRYENYIEIGLKTLKLILTHFSSVIRTTLESQKDSAKLVGVDLSREDRLNKCQNCYKFLMEARSIVAKRCANINTNNSNSNNIHYQQTNKLNSLYRDLQQSFAAFQASFESNQISMFVNHNSKSVNNKRQQ